MLAKSNTWRIDNRCLHIHDSDKGHNGVECWSSLTCECHFSSPSVVFKGSLIRNHAKYLNLHCKFMVSLHTNSCKKKDGAMERLKSTCMHTNSCKKKSIVIQIQRKGKRVRKSVRKGNSNFYSIYQTKRASRVYLQDPFVCKYLSFLWQHEHWL